MVGGQTTESLDAEVLEIEGLGVDVLAAVAFDVDLEMDATEEAVEEEALGVAFADAFFLLARDADAGAGEGVSTGTEDCSVTGGGSS